MAAHVAKDTHTQEAKGPVRVCLLCGGAGEKRQAGGEGCC